MRESVKEHTGLRNGTGYCEKDKVYRDSSFFLNICWAQAQDSVPIIPTCILIPTTL